MRLLAVTILAFFVGGCGGRVQVVDPKGTPIAGAQVAPVSLSISGEAETTDAKGEASVPLSIGQATKWVNVSKPGFESQYLDVPKSWPLKVVLEPAGRP